MKAQTLRPARFEEDLESLVHSSTVPFAVFDAECRFTFVNDALARLNRLPVDAHVGRLVDDVAPDVADFTRRTVTHVIATGATATEPLERNGETDFVVSYFPFRSESAGATRVGIVCLPTRVVDDVNTAASWRSPYAFETLVARIAARLLAVTSESFDGALLESLREICEAQRLARGAIVRFEGDSGRATVSHEWHRVDLPPLGPTMPTTHAFDAADVARLACARGPSLVTVAAIPDRFATMRTHLAEHGIVTLAILPLFAERGVGGVLVLPACEAGLPAMAEIDRRLRLLGDVIAQALVRDERDRALRRVYDEASRLKIEIENERDYLREELAHEIGGPLVVHRSHAMRRVLELADAVARTPATVLVRGESGVGKELVVRAIHRASDRRDAPLVKVNCASIPRDLFESEFFGHTRGAFTGALRDRVGRFELAHGGTLFLDEIGEVPLAEQAKLLRVIQEGEFERVGEERTRRVDVRIVAATNRLLERDVEEGRFRRDLYFRLNVFPIDVPALRERPDDVVPLAEHFVRMHAARLGRRDLSLSAEDRAALVTYAWPGNVRELAHVVERSVILAMNRKLRITLPAAPPPTSSHPPAPLAPVALDLRAPPPPSRAVRSVAELRGVEASMIEDALAASGGRVSGRGGAAERLGLSPSTLRDRIKALGLRRPG